MSTHDVMSKHTIFNIKRKSPEISQIKYFLRLWYFVFVMDSRAIGVRATEVLLYVLALTLVYLTPLERSVLQSACMCTTGYNVYHYIWDDGCLAIDPVFLIIRRCKRT